MPYRDWKFRIRDILDTISTVENYISGMEFPQFAKDRKTVDAVIRNFIVIGEVATHMPDDVVCNNSDIPWNEMRAMRNFVVHEYFGVSDKILWDTATNELPDLVPLLKNILKSGQ